MPVDSFLRKYLRFILELILLHSSSFGVDSAVLVTKGATQTISSLLRTRERAQSHGKSRMAATLRICLKLTSTVKQKRLLHFAADLVHEVHGDDL